MLFEGSPRSQDRPSRIDKSRELFFLPSVLGGSFLNTANHFGRIIFGTNLVSSTFGLFQHHRCDQNPIAWTQNASRNAMIPLAMDIIAGEHQVAVQANETESASIQLGRLAKVVNPSLDSWFFKKRWHALHHGICKMELSAQGHRGPNDGCEIKGIQGGTFGRRSMQDLMPALSPEWRRLWKIAW